MIQADISVKHRLGDADVGHASPFDRRLLQDEHEAIESFVEFLTAFRYAFRVKVSTISCGNSPFLIQWSAIFLQQNVA